MLQHIDIECHETLDKSYQGTHLGNLTNSHIEGGSLIGSNFRITKRSEIQKGNAEDNPLAKIRQLVSLQLQIRINSISTILNSKIAFRQSQAFQTMKKAQNPNLSVYCQEIMLEQIVASFSNRIEQVIRLQTIKYATTFLSSLTKFQNRNSFVCQDQQDSQQDRLREQSDINEVNAVNPVKHNKILKKKRCQMDKQVHSFVQQMSQLLLTHENILGKKVHH